MLVVIVMVMFVIVKSSRIDLDDDVVDVTSSSALDVIVIVTVNDIK